MLIHPQFNPIALQIGPLAVHWYGVMYLIGFGLFIWLGRLRCRQPHNAAAGWQPKDVEDMLFYGVLGVVLGGRLGYVFFYKPDYFLAHPLEIPAVWAGGMSFHGGFIGVMAAMVWFAYSRRRSWLAVMDFVAPCIPSGLAAGRLGNFINGELWGRPADPSLPWAMVFPQSGSMVPRHPSQLYEFGLEGLALFIILWLYARRPHATGRVSALFLIGYGGFRFVAEYFREPDDFLGLLAFNMSMGQWLCLPMILAGIALYIWAGRRAAA